MSKKELAAIRELGSQVEELRKLVGEVAAVVSKVADVGLTTQITQGKHASRLKAIEKKLAESDLLQKKEQGPEEWRKIMSNACSKARGMCYVPIPWEEIEDRQKFEKWFTTDIGRFIIDGKVGPEIKLKKALEECGYDRAPCPAQPITIRCFDNSNNAQN